MPDLTDYGALYMQLGRHLEQGTGFLHLHDVDGYDDLWSADAQRWFARGYALVGQVGNVMDEAAYRNAMDNLRMTSWKSQLRLIQTILYRALAYSEARAPAALVGTFVPVGASFDAFAALGKVFGAANSDVFIVDPYLDEVVLTDFAMSVPAGVSVRLMADEATVKPSLAPAVQRWTLQHGNARPLAARLAPQKTLHDRAIFVDGKVAWTLTQSLKDFAKRSPAEIVRVDDTAALKITAYELVWSAARPI